MKLSGSLPLLLILLLLFSGCGQPHYTKDQIHNALDSSFDAKGAMAIVEYLSDRWRLRGGGNDGYNESLDYVYSYLNESGFEQVGILEVLEGDLTLKPLAWDVKSASLGLAIGSMGFIYELVDNPTLVAKYSGATPKEGVKAKIIDVGEGTAQDDYLGKDVSGKIVLARGAAAEVYRLAVMKHGAIGVISDRLGREPYYKQFPDMVLHEALPFDNIEDVQDRNTWMLKISPKTGEALRQNLLFQECLAQVKIDSRFFEATQRTLMAEIPGKRKQRIVLVAHLDNNKPGANNNASGIAAHAALAKSLATKIAMGILPKPERTITFLFGAEREGSRQWLNSLGEEKNEVIAMINADMAGEGAITGGKYLVEKSPEPTMHLQRAEEYTSTYDAHSGWGFRPVAIDPFPGHFLNDFFWQMAIFRAEKVGLEINKHPFEGGSDHDVFLPSKIPSVLSWHWPDYFISTNMDTPDKVNPDELKNTAIIHGLSAMTLGMGSNEDALDLLELVAREAGKRMNAEHEMTNRYFEENPNIKDEDRSRELELLDRWQNWYKEAIISVGEFSVAPSGKLQSRIANELKLFDQKCAQLRNTVKSN